LLAQLVEHVTFNDVADGSNPSQDTIFKLKNIKNAVVVQLVRIPACHAGGREFESRPPRHCFLVKNGRLAQLVERYPYKVDVTGSSPVVPTINKPFVE
jgi:hypothetical protein